MQSTKQEGTGVQGGQGSLTRPRAIGPLIYRNLSCDQNHRARSWRLMRDIEGRWAFRRSRRRRQRSVMPHAGHRPSHHAAATRLTHHRSAVASGRCLDWTGWRAAATGRSTDSSRERPAAYQRGRRHGDAAHRWPRAEAPATAAWGRRSTGGVGDTTIHYHGRQHLGVLLLWYRWTPEKPGSGIGGTFHGKHHPDFRAMQLGVLYPFSAQDCQVTQPQVIFCS